MSLSSRERALEIIASTTIAKEDMPQMFRRGEPVYTIDMPSAKIRVDMNRALNSHDEIKLLLGKLRTHRLTEDVLEKKWGLSSLESQSFMAVATVAKALNVRRNGEAIAFITRG